MARTIDFQTQIDATLVEPFYAVHLDFSGSVTRNVYTAVLATGEGNRYELNNTQQLVVNVARGNTIVFDQSDSSNAGHPLLLASSLDGTTYSTGVTTTGTPGNAGAKTEWVVDSSAPNTLYYKCGNHSGMGGEINIADPALNLWSGYGEITYDGITYIGAGEFGQISEIKQEEQIKANGINLSLSGIPNDLIASALYEEYQNRTAKVLFGVLTDGVLVQNPYTLFIGKMDVMTIQQAGETSSISLTVENSLIDLKRTRRLLYTDEDQKALHSGDASLRFVEALQNKEVLWGVPYSNVPPTVSAPSQADLDKILEDFQSGKYYPF
jgi:hypothetical protein|tara:strand:+ start:1007 stop:1978 length:972 start_codon:yes stop_codon:yes gene_type:complete